MTETKQMVDLVVIIDTSSSMKDEALALSEATEAAIEAVTISCPLDLRVEWLGIEGTWKATRFKQTLRKYLTEQCKVDETELRGRKKGQVKGGGAQEDGARAIEDVSSHFDWRAGATRTIFYLGDEALEGGGSVEEKEDIEAANLAIQKAKEAEVIVHTYCGTTNAVYKEKLQQEYARVAQETGGRAFTKEGISDFSEVLKEIICTNPEQALMVHGKTQQEVVLTVETEPQQEIELEAESEPRQETKLIADKPEEKATKIVNRYTVIAMGVGLVPLPIVDLAALTGLQLKMIKSIADCYNIRFSNNFGKSLIGSLLSSIVSVSFTPLVGSLLKAIPLVGHTTSAVTMSVTGGASTYAVGKVFLKHFAKGGNMMDFEPNKMKTLLVEQFEEGKKVVNKHLKNQS